VGACEGPVGVREAIRRWWDGVYEEEQESSPEWRPFSLSQPLKGHWKRHWTARWAREVLAFMGREWHRVLPILIGLVGLAIAYARLGVM